MKSKPTLKELIKEIIEDACGDSYEVGHTHGMNPFRHLIGGKPERVDEGWGKYASRAASRIIKEIRK